MSGNPPVLTFTPTGWGDAGAKFLALSQALAVGATSLCQELKSAGPAWGKDDLGSAFISGGGGKPGFATTEHEVMSQLADLVNETAYTGTGMQRTGAAFAATEEALTKSIAGQTPDSVTPAELQTLIDKGVSGIPLPQTYTLPSYSGGTVTNDQPPFGSEQIVSLLEELTPYRQPDGSEGGLRTIAKYLTDMKDLLSRLEINVVSITNEVTESSAGQAASGFGSFTGTLRGAFEWAAGAFFAMAVSIDNLLVQKQTAWNQLNQAVTFLSNAQVTLSRQAQSNMSGAEAAFYNLVRKEGEALLAARKTLVTNVLASLNGTSIPPSVPAPASA